MREEEALGVLLGSFEKVLLGPDGADEGHDDLLADGVDGRVRHLRVMQSHF